MMDQKSLLAGLNPQDRLELLQNSNGPGLRQLALHSGALFLSGIYIGFEAAYWPLVLLPHGIFLIFGFCAMHEAVHKTAFRSGWINNVIADFVGFYLLLPARWFRVFHFAHHRHTNNTELDPELETPKPISLGHHIIYLSGLPLWWSRLVKLKEIASGSIKDPFIPENRRRLIIFETRCYLVGYVFLLAGSLAFQSSLLIWLWIVPALLGQPFLRAYLLAEHTGCPDSRNMLINSRTTETNKLVRLLTWNMPYHVEHHAFPAVPFHKLAQFHQFTRAYISTLTPGYFAFHAEHFRSLK